MIIGKKVKQWQYCSLLTPGEYLAMQNVLSCKINAESVRSKVQPHVTSFGALILDFRLHVHKEI